MKEIYFAFIIIDIFQIFNVDLICIVLHLGVKCTMISDNIFATYKNNPSSSVMFHLHFTQKITFHQKKMVKPYQMFHRFKADINKFQMGKFTSHIVLVGLGGVLLPFTSPAKANRGAFLISLEISHIKRLLQQSSNNYLKYRLPMKDLKLLVYWKQDQYKIVACCE